MEKAEDTTDFLRIEADEAEEEDLVKVKRTGEAYGCHLMLSRGSGTIPRHI